MWMTVLTKPLAMNSRNRVVHGKHYSTAETCLFVLPFIINTRGGRTCLFIGRLIQSDRQRLIMCKEGTTKGQCLRG